MSLLDLIGLNRIFKDGAPVDPTRKILNFIGAVTVVDNPGSLRTDITIGAGGGGGGEGTVVGPDTSTAGNVTTWNSADGTKLADSGLALADVATEAYVDAAVSAVPGTPLAAAGQSSGVGVTSTVGTTGAATTAARSDHTHGHGDLLGGTLHAVASPSNPGFVSAADKTKLDGIATGATATPLVTANQSSAGGVASAASGNTGTATTGARSDHSHGHGDLLGGTLHAVATGTTPGFCSAADKAKLDGITSGATSTPLVTANQATSGGVAATAGNTGTATTAARSDHSHAHGVQTDGTLHAVVTTSVPGFCSAADKTKLDGIATGATSTPLVTASQANGDVIASGGSTGTATTAARSDHTHGHGAQAGGALHAVATSTVAGFLSGTDKGRLDAIYANSQATRRNSRLISIDGWTGDPTQVAWQMRGVTPTTISVLTTGAADANVWYVDLSDDLPPNPLTLTALDVRIAGPAGQTNVPFGSLVAPRWVLASYTRDNVRAVEIAAQVDTSATAAAYQAAHSIAWTGALTLSASKRYVLEVTPESGGVAVSGSRLLSINMSCDYADGVSVTDRFLALLTAKGIFAFEARKNTNNGSAVLSFVDLIDSSRVITLTGAVAVPSPDAFFGGALTCAFGGAKGVCNQAASLFRRLHNGSGMEYRNLARSTSTATQVFLTTRDNGVGFSHYLGADSSLVYITAAGAYPASAVVNGAQIASVSGTARTTHFRYAESTSPNYTHHSAGQPPTVPDVTGTRAAAPSAADSDYTLNMFTQPAGSFPFVGTWFGTYAFQSLTDTERALVDEYQLAMTGVPV